MTGIAHQFRDLLIPVLQSLGAVVALLLAVLLLQRGVRVVLLARREVLCWHYRPRIIRLLGADLPLTRELRRELPSRHRGLIGGLILAHLRVVQGPEATRARELADWLGLVEMWRGLLNANWWQCADAALALGLIRDRQSVGVLIERLNHDHEQVRAAAIDALALIRDPAAITALVACIQDPSRYERARIVDALRSFGEPVAGVLVDLGNRQPSERPVVAGMLAYIGSGEAGATLLDWTADAEPATKAAAWAALAVVGLSDRAYYHAVKALGDADPRVRAAAAKALGRAGRADAAPNLASHLDDEWDVAAPAARALVRLGPAGMATLRIRAAGTAGLGLDLAQQMLWEQKAGE